MSKINELKFKLSEKYAFQVPFDGTNDFYDKKALVGFEKGFDAAMDLQLPVLFANWLLKEKYSYFIPLNETQKNDEAMWLQEYMSARKTSSQLYDYWVKNIYQPEQTQPT